MLTMLKKELREQWRTYRFLVVGAVLAIFGLTSPLMARYIPELIKSLGGIEGLDQLIPTPTVADAVGQYLKNCFQFGVILALLVPMGAVVGEKDRGTAAMVLSKPVSRASFLLSKFVAAALVFLAAILIAALGAYYYTGILFQWLDVGAFLLLNLLFWLDLLVYLALTMLASTLARSTVAAGGIGFGLFMVMWIAGVIPQVGRHLPDALLGWGTRIALGLPGAPAWGALGVSLGLIAAALVGAVVIFRRQEI
jgi:ABC-2 type transport system permease protein